MIQIFARYLTLLVMTVLVLSALSFFLAYLFPGDVLANLSGEIAKSPSQRDALVQRYAFDQGAVIQFLNYLKLLWQGDWGYSFASGAPLRSEISLALPATLELTLYAMAVATIFGIPLGCLAGIRAYTRTDYLINSSAVVGYSFPAFWLALLFILAFSLELGWYPLSGRISLLFNIPPTTGFVLLDIVLSDSPHKMLAFIDALNHLFLPTLSIGILTTAATIRLVRRSVIDVLQQTYVAAAQTRGLSGRQIFVRHVLRNALFPVLQILGLQITTLMTNAMIIETLFSWPGIGNWLIQAIYQQDYPALRMGMWAVAVVVIAVTIVIDFINRIIDPSRERVEHAPG